MTLNPLDAIMTLFKKKKALHELKWKIPEERLTAQIEDAEKYIAALRKHARFISGGEFVDTVHAKEYGENVYAYFIIRVDKKTESEKLLFDGYMIQEDERLDVEVTSAFAVEPHLEKLGYKKSFMRELTLWQFNAGIVKITVYSITDFGDFIEMALPATKFVKARETTENFAFNLFQKIGVKREEVIPTDVNTIELFEEKQRSQQQGAEQESAAQEETAMQQNEQQSGKPSIEEKQSGTVKETRETKKAKTKGTGGKSLF